MGYDLSIDINGYTWEGCDWIGCICVYLIWVQSLCIGTLSFLSIRIQACPFMETPAGRAQTVLAEAACAGNGAPTTARLKKVAAYLDLLKVNC